MPAPPASTPAVPFVPSQSFMTRPVGFSYDVDPATGRAYQTNPEANWYRREVPRGPHPAFAPPPPTVMRDVTRPDTYEATGGTPVARPFSFRRLYTRRRA